ncbi:MULTISPECIES: hypothetical protein [unclassified Moorena]|uniref:hypothetical protein n=1 Tax=unclassified Moorena TaxID=2683338 RepID=UPI0013FCEF93|nr:MULTISPECIES: hypothetical protein [unclassified Moorena]NEO12727.1 hypothetical protein [Moorena sp. SIO3E8]NEP27993.1 hypothetical protein [Moorena sp. SIO3I6]NEP99503.1 hypothetical protein [Moorena sp. SIO3F7]
MSLPLGSALLHRFLHRSRYVNFCQSTRAIGTYATLTGLMGLTVGYGYGIGHRSRYAIAKH